MWRHMQLLVGHRPQRQAMLALLPYAPQPMAESVPCLHPAPMCRGALVSARRCSRTCGGLRGRA